MKTKAYFLSEMEYKSLRDEILQRISLMNTQATSAITIVLTMWASGLGLVGIQMTNLYKLTSTFHISLCFGEIGCFFCSLLVLIPLSLKSGENLMQQIAIGIYLKIFYFSLIKERKIRSKIIYPWEYVNGLINPIFTDNNSKNNILLLFMNAEYAVLGFVSTVFTLSAAINNFNIMKNFLKTTEYDKLFICIIAVIVIIEILLIIFIHLITNLKSNITRVHNLKVENYLQTILQINLITPKEYEKLKKELLKNNTTNEQVRDFA